MSYAERVRAGVALLDEQSPRWWKHVDVACLDMDHCLRCVLGQVFGNYLRGADMLEIDPQQYGFDVGVPYKLAGDQSEDLHYYVLTRLWTYVIRTRQEQGTEREDQHGRVRELRLPAEDQRRVTGLRLHEQFLRGDGEGDSGSADVRAVQHGAPHVGGAS